MKRFFMDDEETIERWKFIAGFIGMTALWGAMIILTTGILA